MPRLIQADVVDSRKSDWTITDDGIDRGTTRRTWPAPDLRPDDRTPALPAKARLTRSGLPDAYGFLRPKTGGVKLDFEDFEDERDGPAVPMADAMGLPSLRVPWAHVPGFGADVPGIDRFEAGMLHRFLRRTDAGALDAFSAGYHACGECAGFIDAAFLASEAGALDPSSFRALVANLRKFGGAKWGALQEARLSEALLAVTKDTNWDTFNRAKALTFQLLAETSDNAPAKRDLLTKIWKGFESAVPVQRGFLGKALEKVGSGVTSLGQGAFAIGKGIATPVASLVTSPVRLANDIAHGKNVFESLRDNVKQNLTSAKELAPYVQAALSVTGVGLGVNAAISAGAALAQGQPITSAIVSGMKGAMGPQAAQAFDTAYNVARGQNLSDAALDALIRQAPGGELGQKAAQTAVALAKGQNLQQAAVALAKNVAKDSGVSTTVTEAVSDIASGKNLGEVAKSAVGRETMVAINKFSPLTRGVLDRAGPRIPNRLGAELPSILPIDSKMVAQTLLSRPELRSLPIEQLASRLSVSTSAVREGMGAVLHAAQKSGGPQVPSLSLAKTLSNRIPMGMNFDTALARFGSRAAPKTYSHNASMNPAMAAARLRQQGSVFHALGARGLDAGALDPKNMPTIRQGSTDASSGGAVSQWQKILGVTADGKFGPQTATATVAFQKKNGLTADGIVGPKTWAAGLVNVVVSTPVPGTPTVPTVPGLPPPITLPPPVATAPIIASKMPTIRRGSTGAEVKVWQQFLGIPNDGIFGPQTEEATKTFQAKNGLVVDGIVGPATWTKAMGGTSTPITPGPSAPPALPPPGFPGTPTGPVINIPPISIPTPTGPITTPGTTIPVPPILTPPGAPPPVSVPPAPPPISTTPPGTPPVVVPPATPPSSGTQKSSIVPIAVGLGLLVLLGMGSSTKILKI